MSKPAAPATTPARVDCAPWLTTTEAAVKVEPAADETMPLPAFKETAPAEKLTTAEAATTSAARIKAGVTGFPNANAICCVVPMAYGGVG